MSKCLLVVDDDARNRKLLRLILSNAGYRVLEADNGFVAVGMAREDRPDLILMDYRMPVMDGVKATQAIKGDPDLAGIPVFIVTSSAMTEEREHIAEASGCERFFTKPIDFSELLGAIAKYVEA